MSVKQTAKLSYLRIAPRKVRLVADLVRGAGVNEAEAQLLMERRRPAKAMVKLLRSAVAGAKARKMDPEKLFIASIRVDQGPMLKRILPRARGMADPIHKKMSHVYLTLEERPAAAKSRFNIVVKKKSKASDKTAHKAPKKAEAEHRHQHETEERTKTATPGKEGNSGLVRRIFRRKSV